MTGYINTGYVAAGYASAALESGSYVTAGYSTSGYSVSASVGVSDVNIGQSVAALSIASSSDYTKLIPSENASRPKFSAMVAAVAGCFADVNNSAQNIEAAFDLDTAAGAQLDSIGLWVGASRYVSTPLAGIYFAFDTVGLGFGQGSWKGPYDPTEGLQALDDDTYRMLIRARIAANHWDGTIASLLAILGMIFTDPMTITYVVDNQDMTMTIGMVGATPSAIKMALLNGGYLVPKPSGVRINYAGVTAVPYFGFDSSTFLVAGFDIGVWS